MCKSTKPLDATFNKTDEGSRSTALIEAIEDVGNFFLKEKEGSLYRLLLNVIEKPLIEKVLRKTEGNQLKAARLLGINRNTLHSKIEKLKINVSDFKYPGSSKLNRRPNYL